jgi:hypothetical protein
LESLLLWLLSNRLRRRCMAQVNIWLRGLQ